MEEREQMESKHRLQTKGPGLGKKKKTLHLVQAAKLVNITDLERHQMTDIIKKDKNKQVISVFG